MISIDSLRKSLRHRFAFLPTADAAGQSVRAGMVSKVEDYRWCGYASAVGGNRWARRGLGRILADSAQISGSDFEERWPETAEIYRLCLYAEGEEREIAESGEACRKRGFTREEVEVEAARSGRMTMSEAIRHRVRYLTEGAVFGREQFGEGVPVLEFGIRVR